MEGIEEIGGKAYRKQSWGKYEEAITIYTQGLKKYPDEKRFLGNRCLCFIELEDYRKALEDADRMTLLFPNYPKSHYRRGEVLMCLKDFKEAEKSFKKVLEMEPDCEDARSQLNDLYILKLCEQGNYTKETAHQALNIAGSVEAAEQLLKFGSIEAYAEDPTGAVYYSDEETTDYSINEGDPDPFLNPSNPFGSTALWIGSVGEEVTEQMLKTLFSKHGQIKSVKLYEGHAFVNFDNSVGPGKAMKNLQGHLLCGQNIVLRYPDNCVRGSDKSAFSKIQSKGKLK